MALVKCKECGKELSDKAKICPHCGYRNGKSITRKAILTFGGILLIVVLFGGILTFTGSKIEENKELKEYDELYLKTKQIMYDDGQKCQNYCKNMPTNIGHDTHNYMVSFADESKILWNNYETIKDNMKKLKEIPNNSYQKSYNQLESLFNGYDKLMELLTYADDGFQENCRLSSESFENAYKNMK